MDDLLTCDICLGNFSQGDHDPLFLQCGHTFCRTCLVRISKEQQFLCPSCRKVQDNVDVNTLPINYKLLSIVTEASELKYETCEDHGDELVYWCQTCNLPLCTLCIFSNHPQEHRVVKGNIYLMEKKRSLEIHTKKWKKTIETSIANNLNRILNELFLWCFSEAKFSKTQNDVDDLMAEITETIKSDDLHAVELKIKSLMLECEKSGCKVETDDDDAGKEMSVNEPLDGTQWKKPFCCILNNDGRRAAIQWQDGKILMSSFSDEPIDCDLIFQMPREIYLELSIKSECLGLVIIQPWYHLRRAQQFAVLCQGTFGVSYKGSSFHSIRFKGEPGEYLFGGWYLNPHDEVPRCRNLMTDLEWGGIATGEFREGIVMGAGENVRGGESGFGICTRDKRNGSLNCPIGEVVSGLDVVKRAIKHDPVTEVTISRCGVVVSNLMP